ncbi:MAG: hypothetical protein DPW15_16795 [Chloroflexi bacterium]|nr:hypothetical protein [Chloroflexota bacterium]
MPAHPLKLQKLDARAGDIAQAFKGERLAFSGDAKDFIPFTVYDRYKLYPGAEFPGPAIIEERESTIIVGEGATVSVDQYGFLWMEMPTE